jgi:hypothetical protein
MAVDFAHIFKKIRSLRFHKGSAAMSEFKGAAHPTIRNQKPENSNQNEMGATTTRNP